MATNFSDEELSWLKATKRSYEQKDLLHTSGMPERKNIFVDDLRKLFSSNPNRSELDVLIDKIDRMSTHEFWNLYKIDFG
jgi:hypothetical protein